MKKIDEFKEEINQKFAAITPNIAMMNLREISKKLDKLTKTVQSLHDRFNKDM